jgi:hypothetical protein
MPWDLGASTLEVPSQPANKHLQNERERSCPLMLNEIQRQGLVLKMFWSAQSAGPGIKGSPKRYIGKCWVEADQNRLQWRKWNCEICGLQFAR